jgi:hypothetical protein
VRKGLQFGTAEHMKMGNVPLSFTHDKQEMGDNVKLIKNLTYGQIIALGGDFFENAHPDEQLSSAGSMEEKKKRFTTMFQSLLDADPTRLEAIFKVAAEEFKDMTSGKKEGLISEILMVRKYNSASDGALLELAMCNFDHFGMDAHEAYFVGHTVAMEEAVRVRALPEEEHDNGLKMVRSESHVRGSPPCFVLALTTPCNCFAEGLCHECICGSLFDRQLCLWPPSCSAPPIDRQTVRRARQHDA